MAQPGLSAILGQQGQVCTPGLARAEVSPRVAAQQEDGGARLALPPLGREPTKLCALQAWPLLHMPRDTQATGHSLSQLSWLAPGLGIQRGRELGAPHTLSSTSSDQQLPRAVASGDASALVSGPWRVVPPAPAQGLPHSSLTRGALLFWEHPPSPPCSRPLPRGGGGRWLGTVPGPPEGAGRDPPEQWPSWPALRRRGQAQPGRGRLLFRTQWGGRGCWG